MNLRLEKYTSNDYSVNQVNIDDFKKYEVEKVLPIAAGTDYEMVGSRKRLLRLK